MEELIEPVHLKHQAFIFFMRGPIGVLKQTLLEIDYDDLLEKTETKQSKAGG